MKRRIILRWESDRSCRTCGYRERWWETLRDVGTMRVIGNAGTLGTVRAEEILSSSFWCDYGGKLVKAHRNKTRNLFAFALRGICFRSLLEAYSLSNYGLRDSSFEVAFGILFLHMKRNSRAILDLNWIIQPKILP